MITELLNDMLHPLGWTWHIRSGEFVFVNNEAAFELNHRVGSVEVSTKTGDCVASGTIYPYAVYWHASSLRPLDGPENIWRWCDELTQVLDFSLLRKLAMSYFE
jgi:hypothetical protein